MKKREVNSGCFVPDPVPKAKQPITVRLPRSLDEKVRAVMSQRQLIEWVRQAAIEKFEREGGIIDA